MIVSPEKKYGRTRAYAQSKLANLLFAFELQRKLEAAGKKTISNGSHPGWTKTQLQRHTLGFRILNPIFAQNIHMGALPMLYAATAPEANGGEYFGPRSLGGMRGHPKKADPNKKSQDLDVAKQLWEISEELTGVKYSI